ncbi:aquaporin, partial [Streptococcus thermophilus]|nr:aquaporin [Streptococcus thermophilus]
RYFWNFISEVIGTFVLVFGLLAFTKGQFTAGLNPIVVGILIIAIGLSLGGTTGYAINPARDLGPRIAHAVLPIANKGTSDWAYSWVPIAGPLVG